MISIGIFRPDAGNVFVVHSAVPLVKGLGPVTNIIFACGKSFLLFICYLNRMAITNQTTAGHVAFPFCAELKRPSGFPKALAFMQITTSTFYPLISAVIYYYAGPHVASPALGSTLIIAKIAFGLTLPAIIIAGVVNGYMARKYLYVRMWKGTNVIHQNDLKSVGGWWGFVRGCGS